MVPLELVEAAPGAHHVGQYVAHAALRQPRGAGVVRVPGLEDSVDARRQLRRGQALPEPGTQALGGHEVQLGVDPSQPLTGGRDRVAIEIAEHAEDLAYPVELAGDGVRPGLRSLADLLGLTQQAVIALAPAGVVLALVAAVTRVLADSRPQPRDLGVLASSFALAATWPFVVRDPGAVVAARSRRLCGLRALKDFGIRRCSIASTGDGKSSTESRRTWRSAVRTVGRGSVSPEIPGSRTTASPALRPAGTRITSPTLSTSRAWVALARRWAAPVRASSASRSLSARRSAAYSSKSPRWQVIDARKPSSDCSLRRT